MVSPLMQAGANHSQSSITAGGRSMMHVNKSPHVRFLGEDAIHMQDDGNYSYAAAL
jgi:hypothetical protein